MNVVNILCSIIYISFSFIALQMYNGAMQLHKYIDNQTFYMV